LNSFWWRELRDPVSQIKDMSALLHGSESIKDSAHFGTNCLLATKEGNGIKVSLKGN
jgi:hypothetical protein